MSLNEEIGSGRFGKVYRGNWHGSVAVKVLDVHYLDDDEKTLEAFKSEVRCKFQFTNFFSSITVFDVLLRWERSERLVMRI